MCLLTLNRYIWTISEPFVGIQNFFVYFSIGVIGEPFTQIYIHALFFASDSWGPQTMDYCVQDCRIQLFTSGFSTLFSIWENRSDICAPIELYVILDNSCTCQTNQQINECITVKMSVLSPNRYIWTRSEPLGRVQIFFVYFSIGASGESFTQVHIHALFFASYCWGPHTMDYCVQNGRIQLFRAVCQHRTLFQRKGPIYALPLNYM